MKRYFPSTSRGWVAAVLAVSIVAVGATQIRQAIKIIGVGAAVERFGPDMNKAINRLSKHTDSVQATTKVVPILTVGISKSSAIGAAQVTGPKAKVDQVEAVAQLTTDLFGREIRINALVPVSDKDVTKGIKKVDGVGITGIVDLKL